MCEEYCGITIRDTTHGELGASINIPAGTPVRLTRVDNMPADSLIKWWGTLPRHLFDDPQKNEQVDGIQRLIGFGFLTNEVKIAEEGQMMVDCQVEDEEYTVADWQSDVAKGDTRVGYQVWVARQKETDAEDPELDVDWTD